MNKGFLFSMDALIAALILIGGLVLIGSIADQETDTSKLTTAGEDTIIALHAVNIYDIEDAWIQQQVANNSIPDENVTVLEQIGYFWATGRQAEAKQLAETILNGTYEGYSVRLTIDDQEIYFRNETTGEENTIVANRMISGIAQGEAVKGSSASAYLKRIKDKRDFVLIPFGGFVGEGNISLQTDGIPADANLTDIIIELDTEREFDFVINGIVCDRLSPTPSLLVPSAWERNNCSTSINPGSTNAFDMKFTGDINGSFVAGGFVKIGYTTDLFSSSVEVSETIYTFPRIDGLINLFDGFYIGGNITSMNVTLHFLSNYTSYLTIGNASWSFPGSPVDQNIILNESQIQSGFTIAGLAIDSLSRQTVPLRFGIGSVAITGAPSDTIVVTDTSGSMEWCTNQTEAECFQACGCPPGCASGGGTCGSTNCGIYSTCAPGDEEKISAARTATNNFINTMLNNSGVLMGLVEFANSIKSSEPLTNNAATLTTEVSGYTANGGTCVCCGVNDAVDLLASTGFLLIPRSTAGWMYNEDDLASPPAGWTTLGFDDSGWDAGVTAIGSGYSGLNTNVGGTYQGDYYYRKKFNVTNASDILSTSLYVYSDDGAEVYLNGNLIDDDYPNVHSALYWNRNNISVAPGLLVEGENILAVRQWHRQPLWWWPNSLGFNLEFAASYNQTAAARTKNIVVMTDGVTNTQCGQQGTGTATGDAIQSACDAYTNDGINVYTVGFGKDADVATLQAMAACANGQYFNASDADDLDDAFGLIADSIIDASATQRAIIEGELVQTILYGDSIIQANYTPDIIPPQANEITLSLQSDPLANCSSIVELHAGSRFVDALVTSYSGDFWTDRLTMNGNLVYNLSSYATTYASFGDPYRIQIPPSILIDGNNTMDMAIAIDQFNTSVNCSLNNTVVYTVAINLSTERSTVVPLSEGCQWIVEVEDGSILNLTIPASYGGANDCIYNSTNITYNDQDAYQLGAYKIFAKLDFKNEGKLFVNLNEEDLEVIVTTISGVPYMWGPAIAKIEVMR